jgi:hypothetical protein
MLSLALHPGFDAAFGSGSACAGDVCNAEDEVLGDAENTLVGTFRSCG